MNLILTNIRTILSFAALCFSAALVLVVFIPATLVALGCAAVLWIINGLLHDLDTWSWIRKDMNKVFGGEDK